MLATNVLNFPAQTTCDVCGRSCSEDDLGGCFTCDTRFCRSCSTCECDKQVADLAARIADLKPSFVKPLTHPGFNSFFPSDMVAQSLYLPSCEGTGSNSGNAGSAEMTSLLAF